MIRGVVAAVPKNVITNVDEAFIKATGVRERRIAPPDMTALNLAEVAMFGLLGNQQLGWHGQNDKLDAIICVTQTASSKMPGNAFRLASFLGAKCPAFDVNLACSGYIYGLWLAHKIGGRVLLIAGDTVSKMAPPDDMLFGDCVSVTAIETQGEMEHPVNWVMGSNGSGYKHLIADPVIRMNGPEVMNFALQNVPQLVHDTTMNATCDTYLFHMANKLILDSIMKRCKIPAHKMPMNISRWGNCSSASIPLLIADGSCPDLLNHARSRVAMFGFGAGWSTAGCMLDLDMLLVSEVVEV